MTRPLKVVHLSCQCGNSLNFLARNVDAISAFICKCGSKMTVSVNGKPMKPTDKDRQSKNAE